MKKALFLIVIALAVFSNGYALGFKKIVTTEKIGNYYIGNYYLFKHKTDTACMYSFTMRDMHYNADNFLQVKLGTKAQAISFFENAISTYETMEVGEKYDLGLLDGNVGYCIRQFGKKFLRISVGEIGEYGDVPKDILKRMLRDLKAEP